jgi:antitoxin component of MazEF toxin-antitoxin module
MKTQNPTAINHTPGPWMIFESGDIASAAVRTPDHLVIKSGTVKGQTIAVAMANAKLIAAAPELLESLKIAEAWLNNLRVELRDGGSDDMAKIRAAIAKATAKD